MNKTNFWIWGMLLAFAVFSYPVMAQEVVAVPTQGDIQVTNPEEATETVILRRKQKYQTEGQPIYMQQVQSAPIYNQPQTLVEASPLEHSQASQLRDARHRAEIATEQKIVEKLEKSRLEDERRRAQKLFGDAFDSAPVAPPQPVYQPQPLHAVEAVVVPQAPQNPVDVEEMKSDIYNSVKSDLEREKVEASQQVGSSYFAGTIGTADYSEAYNVANNSSVGFAFGSKVDEYFTVEGVFNLSNFYIEEEYWLYKEMDQYNLAVAGKYSFLPGKVQPYVGGVASFTHRKYRDLDSWGYQYTSSSEATSQSFDVGANFGVDLMLSKKLAIGFDYKYMINITSRDDFASPYKSFYRKYSRYGEEFIENMDYQIMSISAKVRF